MDPPLFDGGVKATDTWASPAVAVMPVGASGGPKGIALTLAEAVPEPAAFMARSPMAYVVPLVRPVIVTGLLVSAGANGVQLFPPSVLYS